MTTISKLNLTAFDWKAAQWSEAARRVPALGAVLVVAILSHHLPTCIVAAGACLSVGLVGTRQIAGSNVWAMIVASLVMAGSAWIGTVVGQSLWLNPTITGVWGLGFAFLAVHDEDSGWIAMQGVIALVIAMAFPSHGLAALERAVAVLLGGLLQTAFVLGFEGIRSKPVSAAFLSGATPQAGTLQWQDLVQSFTLLSAATHYAFRVSVTLIIATEIARLLTIPNSYWLPMTMVVIMKPDFYRTYSGAVQRVTGTFVGVIIASIITHLFHPGTDLLLILIMTFAFGCFALLKVNSILFSGMLTGYVVFLIALTGLPEATVTGHRLILTALGSSLALGSRVVGYHSILVLLGKRPEPGGLRV